MNCLWSLVLMAAAGYIGYTVGRAMGYDEAMSGRRVHCRPG